jgi:hypothetical protein
LACHLQIHADPVPDPVYHFDADPGADPDPDFIFDIFDADRDADTDFFVDADPDADKVTKMMRIHADRIHNIGFV